MSILTKVYQATDIGTTRPTNEDSLACIEPDTYIVADGMGGHAAGEVASRILVDTARAVLAPDTVYSEQILREVVLQANRAMLEAIQQHPEYTGMGTTATLFHREGGQGYWAHVGDSRLYLLHQDCLQQITRDHSLVSDLVDNGSITPAEARVHPRRNVLTRAVGVEADLTVDTGSFPLQSGDMVLLCSDGLTTVLSDTAIQQILQDDPAEDKADALVKNALAAQSHDNITAIVVMIYDV